MTDNLLGIITIGQSPRADFVRAFAAHAPHADVQVLGALDELSHTQIDELARQPTDYPLLVRLRDGSTRHIGMSAIHPRVQVCAVRFANMGARAVVVACAGGFPDVVCDSPVILPGRVLPAVARAIARTNRIGIVTPIRGQANAAQQKWIADGFDPKVTWASPVAHAEIDAAVEAMRDASLSLIVLDCMGHDDDYRREFAERCGKPVLLAQSLAARIAGELM